MTPKMHLQIYLVYIVLVLKHNWMVGQDMKFLWSILERAKEPLHTKSCQTLLNSCGSAKPLNSWYYILNQWVVSGFCKIIPLHYWVCWFHLCFLTAFPCNHLNTHSAPKMASYLICCKFIHQGQAAQSPVSANH